MTRSSWTLPVVLLAVALAACAGDGGSGGGSAAGEDAAGRASEADRARNEELLDGVAEQLRGQAEFERLEVGYTDSLDNAGLVVVDGYCRDCDEAALADTAARLVWRSEVAPLRTLRVSVTDTATSTRARAGGSAVTERDRLTERYGERPAPAGPGGGS